ncbi:MAG: response regulator transcription factor [Caldilineaceae bacterium]|nr:response regulator transcription factor [Caldilineaceae bacterium]
MATLMIVEDHVNLAGIVATYLGLQESLEVATVVHSGEAALIELADLSVDLAVVDVSLPGMSGIELVAVLAERQPDLPCLMLSGHNDPWYVRQALEAGARGYVSKGNPPDLLEAVRCVLAGGTYVSSGLQ